MSKILVVDDHAATRLLLKRQLQQGEYDVTVATDGSQALQLAVQHHPALIICDWMMPAVDGLEVCRRIKADPELTATFFILLTSKGELADRVQGLDAGADDFLSKPVEPSELLARVRAGLRLHQSQLQLSRANQQLSKALQELQQTQVQLIQSEKMSSLGQLVAGIAHEINNPISFIHGNLNYANKYVQDLISFVRLYRNYPIPEIEAEAEAIELEFAISDLGKIFDSMKIGAERIRDIVLSLRNFSRLDEAEMKVVDIHEGIDSTLWILQHRLQTIEIIKEYGDLPEIECYPGQLNQVFLNILNNAIDALTQKQNPSNWIAVRTSLLDNQHVAIAIADNGIGIEPANIKKIFDPFFTTKSVGYGKGLGLTIGYKIVVEKHGGDLQCFSEFGNGTQLTISLPLRQSSVQSL